MVNAHRFIIYPYFTRAILHRGRKNSLNPTPKPKVMETPNLACVLVFSKKNFLMSFELMTSLL